VDRIVVGLTDTPAARMALRWAVRTARAEGAALYVVTAYHASPALGMAVEATIVLPDADLEAAARDEQDRVLREELGDDALDMPLTQDVVKGDAAHVLIELSEGANLLVVGRRKRRFRRMVHSTSRSCANGAPCPVVMVRREMKVTPVRPTRRSPRGP